MDNIKIQGDYIKLQDILKYSGLCMTGGHAKLAVQNGEVKLNGEVCTMRGKKVKDGDVIKYNNKEIKAVFV